MSSKRLSSPSNSSLVYLERKEAAVSAVRFSCFLQNHSSTPVPHFFVQYLRERFDFLVSMVYGFFHGPLKKYISFFINILLKKEKEVLLTLMQSFYLKIETSPPNHLYQTATGSSHPISPKSHAVHHPAKTSCLLYGKNFRQGWVPWATVAFNVGNATSAQGTSTWIARLPSRIGHPFWYTRWVQSLNNFDGDTCWMEFVETRWE